MSNVPGIKPCKQRGPRGGALRVVVKLGNKQPFLGKAVDIGGLDFRAETTDIRPSHIIDHDENDVRAVWNRLIAAFLTRDFRTAKSKQ